MIISFVVAAAENNVIGKDNRLPWRLPNDLKFFKNTTWAMPVIMGRKTYESFGKPLAGRTNIVITRRDDWNAEGVIKVKSLDEALQAAEETDAKEAFIIGGGEIFRQSFSMADKIYITRVHTQLEGDAYFPEIREGEWELFSQLDCAADEKHAYSYSFQLWKRKK
ncbi:MAG: dihydrofolate reductase [Williamsia sp.]|nr:dihydrofolate reductase [Williamsia sp.]